MVVAAYNEADVLKAKLANTWAIDYPPDRFQLVIGSDGSSDGTAELLAAADDPRLKARVYTQRRGKISVLNDLMREVDADIVVMSDANTMFAPDSVRRLVAHFSDPRVGCVSLCIQLTRSRIAGNVSLMALRLTSPPMPGCTSMFCFVSRASATSRSFTGTSLTTTL